MFIKDNIAWINVELACEILGLTRSSYYEWLSDYDNKLKQAVTYNYKVAIIIQLFYKFKKRYGVSRLSNELAKSGIVLTIGRY
jgi:hypothetical protein